MQPDYLTHRLRNQLKEHGSSYDLVFIDCPPQLGKLLTAALYSADYVIVPCAADAMGLQGLSDLSFTIEQVRKNVNSELQMLGAVINLYKPQRNLSAESRGAVEAAINLVGHVFDTNLHDYSKIAEAPSQKLPAVLYARTHRSADPGAHDDRQAAEQQYNDRTDTIAKKLLLDAYEYHQPELWLARARFVAPGSQLGDSSPGGIQLPENVRKAAQKCLLEISKGHNVQLEGFNPADSGTVGTADVTFDLHVGDNAPWPFSILSDATENGRTLNRRLVMRGEKDDFWVTGYTVGEYPFTNYIASDLKAPPQRQLVDGRVRRIGFTFPDGTKQAMKLMGKYLAVQFHELANSVSAIIDPKHSPSAFGDITGEDPDPDTGYQMDKCMVRELGKKKR